MAKIAILGYGTVGSGTVEVFYKNKESLEKKAGQELDIKYILDIRIIEDSPYRDKFVTDYNIILNDPEISVVTELIGGINPSYNYVKSALEAGKSVVTSNKELVAKKGAELLALAKEKGVNFFFEASVGGGIPIIRPLHHCLSANEICGIAGILNGTTNFILTKMISEGMAFDDALSIAQKLGYAERNPSADVDGDDTCRKICILASLAYGRHVYPESVYTEGITKITLEDVAYAESNDCVIKLIGYAEKCEDKISIMVCPAFISKESQLSSVNDVFNAILVRGDATGDVVFYGKGAGKLPTASAVVSDIVVASKMDGTSKSLYWEDSDQNFILDSKSISHSYYIRLSANNKENVKAEIKNLFGDVKYLCRNNTPENEFALVTGEIPEGMFDKACEKLSENASVLGKLRILNY